MQMLVTCSLCAAHELLLDSWESQFLFFILKNHPDKKNSPSKDHATHLLHTLGEHRYDLFYDTTIVSDANSTVLFFTVTRYWQALFIF